MSRIGISWFWCVIFFVLLGGLVMGSSVLAKDPPFVLERGFLHPDLFDIGGRENEVGFIFQNPARTLPSKPESYASTAYTHTPDFYGYDQLSGAFLLSQDHVSIGVGAVTLSKDNIVGNTPNAPFSPPNTVEPYADGMSRISGVMAVRCNPKLRIGAQGTLFGRQFATIEATYIGLDAGFYYDTPYEGLSVGAYTHNALHTDYEWLSEDSPESLRQQVVLEADYRWDDFTSRLSTDFDEARGLIQYWASVNPYQIPINFGLHGDIVADDDFSVTRYGIGASLECRPTGTTKMTMPIASMSLQLVYWFHVIQMGGVDTAHELGVRLAI